jgi:hypothetical protein
MYGPAVRCDDDVGAAFAAAHVAGRRLQGPEDGETVEIVKGVSTQPDALGRNVCRGGSGKIDDLIVTKKDVA